MTVDLDKMSLAQLTKLNERIERAMPAARTRTIAESRKDFEAVAERHGLSFATLVRGETPRRVHKKPGKAPFTKLAPKWIDRESGIKWVGRGRIPKGFDKARAVAIAPGS